MSYRGVLSSVSGPGAAAPSLVTPSLLIWALLSLAVLGGCADDAGLGVGGGGGEDEVTGVGGGDDGDGSGGSPSAGTGSTGSTSGTGGDVGASSSSSGGGDTSSSSGTGGGGPVCPPPPACDAPLPDLGDERGFDDPMSTFYATTGFPVHRGRDMFYNPGDPVWIMGKFTYGIFDKDLKGEEVDIYLLRDCGEAWEYLDTVETTAEDDSHPTTEGVDDSGGWVFYQLPEELALAPGRHRFELVVGGDLSHTSVIVDVVDPGTPLIVSDVDGTLTTSENEEFTALLTGSLPDANPDSAAVLHAMQDKGYRIFYLTARPEFLVDRTRDFLEEHGFPPGIVHTTLDTQGATGDAAITYKTNELAAIAARGLVPSWAFGNSETDAAAFFNAGIGPDPQRVFYQFEDTAHGGRTVQSYAALLPEIGGLPLLCE
jgi:hypothetical protein